MILGQNGQCNVGYSVTYLISSRYKKAYEKVKQVFSSTLLSCYVKTELIDCCIQLYKQFDTSQKSIKVYGI